MSRVIAFGCSNTYGHGLPDCHIEPDHAGDALSVYAFPQLIADRLGYECINKSAPGGSNRRMWYNIINHRFAPGDLVLCHWSFINRYTYFSDKGEVQNLGMWSNTHKVVKAWQRYNGECNSKIDRLLESLCLIDHSNRYLKTQPVHVVNIKWGRKEIADDNPIWCDFEWHVPETEDLMHTHPKALDGKHMGAQAHQVIADRIMQHLTTVPNWDA